MRAMLSMGNLARSVHQETLDHLSETDPRAIRSRADLRRIHRVMRSRAILLSALRKTELKPRRVIELGAGDGTLMLNVARQLAKYWPNVHLSLLDRQNLVSAKTLQAFRELGWTPEVMIADVQQWLVQPGIAKFDLAVANLFIHHFRNEELAPMLRALSQRTDAVFFCEPRRGWLPLTGSHMVGLLGAKAVTRQDAVLSVHAGFAGNELSSLWPADTRHSSWRLREYSAGLFSHCFMANRTDMAMAGDDAIRI